MPLVKVFHGQYLNIVYDIQQFSFMLSMVCTTCMLHLHAICPELLMIHPFLHVACLNSCKMCSKSKWYALLHSQTNWQQIALSTTSIFGASKLTMWCSQIYVARSQIFYNLRPRTDNNVGILSIENNSAQAFFAPLTTKQWPHMYDCTWETRIIIYLCHFPFS